MEFKFPKIHDFPPFYTKQPHEGTYKAQIEQWINIILKYCEFKHIWKLELNESNGNYQEIFNNKKIERKINDNLLQDVINEMIKLGYCKYINKGDFKNILIYWKNINEWSLKLIEWINKSGQNGSILTVYEIQNNWPNEEFYGIDDEIIYKVLEKLEKDKKVACIRENNEIVGIKV